MFTIQTFTFNPFHENTYVLFNKEKQAIIIDPGAYDNKEKFRLENFIEDNGLEVKYLLNTHCHIDHVFGEKYFSHKYNATPHIHLEEEEILFTASTVSEQYGLEFEEYKGNVHFIDEKDKIILGQDQLQIIFTPGHSPGSLSFYCEKQKFVISGDVLFRQSIGRTDLYKGNHQQLLHSIKEKLFTLPDDTTVYPGHGHITSIGFEKINNPFL